MATVRYQVDEIPAECAAAFFPSPGLTPHGQFSLRRFIHGYPGTMRVPSPRPAGAYRASPSPQFQSPSDVAPNWFAPQIWWSDINELPVGPTASGCGIRYLPHRVAVVPPPVGTINGVSQIAMTGRKVGGRRSMHWPRLVPRWPNLSGKYNAD